MFTIQVYFIFIKTGCAGLTLNTTFIHTKTFLNNLLSDYKIIDVDCLNLNFSGLLNG